MGTAAVQSGPDVREGTAGSRFPVSSHLSQVLEHRLCLVYVTEAGTRSAEGGMSLCGSRTGLFVM